MDETDPLAVLVEGATRSEKPTLESLLKQINELGYGTPEYFDCMAFLFITLARSQWRRADQARASNRRTERLAAARAEDGRRVVRHGTCSVCNTLVRLKLDGALRAHDPGSGAASPRWRGTETQRCAGSGQAPRG